LNSGENGQAISGNPISRDQGGAGGSGTGGGGGASNRPANAGGNGGGGIVIIRYPITSANSITTRLYTENGGYRIFTFDATGTLTI
jgi:hypothetical protein